MRLAEATSLDRKSGGADLSRRAVEGSAVPRTFRGRGTEGPSVFTQLGYGAVQVFRLRQNGVFENGLIRHECIHGGYALVRGIEVLKKLVRYPGRDFCSVSPAQHIFVGDDDPASLLYRGRNRVPVVRVEGTQIDKDR